MADESNETTTTNNDVGTLVRELETAFINGGGTLMSKYVTSDLYDDINKIEAYMASQHWSGDTDSQGREKPFFNVVVSARNIWFRATKIAWKKISVATTKVRNSVISLVAGVLLRRWMKKESFASFLVDWGIVLATYNSAVVKFIESEGKLHKMVIPWTHLICDQIDFDNNPKIEPLEFTPGQLRKRVKSHGYDKDMVEALIAAQTARELTDHQKQDQKANYIKVYELHMYDKLSYLTGRDEDADEYVQQMHVVSFVAKKEEGQFDEYTLVSGREAQDPYLLTWLLPNTDGSISLWGSVKNLFQSQWMLNHSAKAVKDQLDLASLLFFQTADSNYVGRNALTAIQTGDIMVHAENKPLTQVNNTSHDISVQQSSMQMWKGLAAEVNGISESMLGQTAPSGTAWRQVETLLAESHSLFDEMKRNKAMHIDTMLRRFVIPHLKKQMDTSEEIGEVLAAENVTKIDSMYVPAEAIKRYNKRTKDQILSYKPGDALPSPFDPATEEAGVKSELTTQGNQRFFVPSDIDNSTWADVVKDIEWELDFNLDGDDAETQLILTTLTTALQAVVNPAYANNPQAQLIVSKIMLATGQISPLEVSSLPPPQPQVPASVGGGSGGLPAQTQ